MKNFELLFKKYLSDSELKFIRGSFIKLKMLSDEDTSRYVSSILESMGVDIGTILGVQGVTFDKSMPVLGLRKSERSYIERYEIMSLSHKKYYYADTVLVTRSNCIVCVRSKCLLSSNNFCETIKAKYEYDKWNDTRLAPTYRLIVDTYGNINEKEKG